MPEEPNDPRPAGITSDPDLEIENSDDVDVAETDVEADRQPGS